MQNCHLSRVECSLGETFLPVLDGVCVMENMLSVIVDSPHTTIFGICDVESGINHTRVNRTY